MLVELKARFDEESNIEWARALEAAGVHVVYGLVGLKVHSKVALVVRREGETMRRYVHLGTGNYNPTTARLYTDLSFFTADEQIGADVDGSVQLRHRLFREDRFSQAAGGADQHAREAGRADPARNRARVERARTAHLIFKMNALEDPGMIRLLYQASQAGVRVRSAGARHLLPAAGRARRQRKYPRDQHRRPVPGA